MSAPDIHIDEHLIDEIAYEMDLRAPNRDALVTLAGHLSVWQHGKKKSTPEYVFDLATGVGKTYLLVASINYLAQLGVRNFLVFVPRNAILVKTINNLTPGHPKSIVDSLPFRPTVITGDDLDTPATASSMVNADEVKVYVVTVQSLAGRDSEVKRRAHEFREELGTAFYETLKTMDDLVVFADEHHTYYGPSFSSAVRGLEPLCLVGLTGTPDPKTPDEQIVYRYPLANAIEDQHVKRPVIVGRSDELSDERTKLYDGTVLLRAKQKAADHHADHSGAPRRKLLMLVVSENIEEASRIEVLLQAPDFFGGDYEGRVLRVDSSQPEEALTALETIEDESSPYRIVVSVAMLKEGWDVATVAVICSLRPSVSDLLTEQTLGRGLRLPWGKWVPDQLLNELDVVAHASYEKVLEQAQVLTEQRVDWRTWRASQQAQLEEQAQQAASRQAAERIREEVQKLTRSTVVRHDADTAADGAAPSWTSCGGATSAGSTPKWASELRLMPDRIAQVQAEATSPGPLQPHLSLGQVAVPVIRVEDRLIAAYELSDVLAEAPQAFVELGQRFARDPEGTLRRAAVVARTETGADGIPVTRLITVPAETKITSDASPPPLPQVREHLISAVLSSNYASGRIEERNTAAEIVGNLIQGADEKALSLGAFLEQVTGALLHEIGSVVGRLEPKTRRSEVVEHARITWTRPRAQETSDDLLGEFQPGIGYTGWARHLYDEARFHSSPERTVALAEPPWV